MKKQDSALGRSCCHTEEGRAEENIRYEIGLEREDPVTQLERVGRAPSAGT